MTKNVEPQVTIRQLAESPEHLPVVAEWIYNQWWRRPDNTVEVVASLLREHNVPDRLPLTLVAFVDDRPVGSACLIFNDLEERPELSPWMAAVFVRPEFRRRRIGSALVRAAAQKARDLGIDPLYLCTVNQQAFYTRLGWQSLEHNVGRYRQTVMKIQP